MVHKGERRSELVAWECSLQIQLRSTSNKALPNLDPIRAIAKGMVKEQSLVLKRAALLTALFPTKSLHSKNFGMLVLTQNLKIAQLML